MAERLNQVLSIEMSVRNKREDEFTKLYQAVQKPELLNGFSKTYQPKDETGDAQPPQSKKVQIRADEVLKEVQRLLTDAWDLTSKKEVTNTIAKADVVVDGVVLLKDVPSSLLLHLGKKLTDLSTFIKKLPILSPDEDWQWNSVQGLWHTPVVETASTKKVVEFAVVVQPTVQHPAQVKEVSKDITVGTWKTVKLSGALTKSRVDELSERVDKLSRAVKYALEDANKAEAIPFRAGDALLGYLFAPSKQS